MAHISSFKTDLTRSVTGTSTSGFIFIYVYFYIYIELEIAIDIISNSRKEFFFANISAYLKHFPPFLVDPVCCDLKSLCNEQTHRVCIQFLN